MIVVTGGAGFIGSNLVAALESRQKRVIISDWLGHGDKWRNIAKRDLEAFIRPEGLDEYLTLHSNAIEAIFHMGAISTTTETDADLIIETNFRLSCKLWNWCKEHKKPFIYASSAATYGNGSYGFKDDETPAALASFQPLNPYGWSKHLFDRWVAQQKVSGNKGPSQCVGLKFFNVYGPNEYHKGSQRSVAHQIYPFAKDRKPFSLFKSYDPKYADGGQLRDFIWVGDCVNVMIWLLENRNVNGLFNLGSGKARSFKELANCVFKALGEKPLIDFSEMPVEIRNQYQYYTEADMTKLRTAGYNAPLTPLEDGIKKYVQHFLIASDQYA